MTDLFVALALLLGFHLLLRRRALRAGSPAAALVIAAGTLAFGGLLCAVLWVLSSVFHPSIAGLALLLSVPGPLRPRPRLAGPGFLEGRAVLVLAGLASFGLVAFVWGSAQSVPMVHDEQAYLLQARIFASLRWVAPARPLPEFFEQMHVFVTPFLAAKYPPGHSLLLVPGVWLGWPALVPLLINGLAAALLFAHARRIAGGVVALFAWLLWVTDPGTFAYRASYLSENTTTVLWLLSLWALREWLDGGKSRWAAVLALSLGWGAITRPMTMFAFGIPIGLVFLGRVWRRRAWADLALAVAAGGACLAVLPLWSAKTMGDWRVSPYSYYSRVYHPYDWIGFGVRPEPPLRPMPKSMEAFDRQFKRIHAEHTLRALPLTLRRRLGAIGQNQWGSGREPLGLAALLGALELDRTGVFALVSALGLVAAYLSFAHSPAWTPYYLEIQTFLSFLTALGLCGVVASVGALAARQEQRERRARGPASLQARLWALLLAAVLVGALGQVGPERAAMLEKAGYEASFRRRIEELPDGRSIVFVRYAPAHDVHRSLVANVPDLDTARTWIVHDLGDHDADLARLAPERAPYLYDETLGSFRPIAPPR
ncbi:MAG: glycosyltransferase family 39 protein [Thermoanaerobaculia bacterium]